MIEIFFTCWLILLSDGSMFCYCEGEDTPAIPAEQVVSVAEPNGKQTLYEEVR